MSPKLLPILGAVAAALGVLAFFTLFTVYQTQQALVLQFGEYKLVCARHPGSRRLVPGYGNYFFSV